MKTFKEKIKDLPEEDKRAIYECLRDWYSETRKAENQPDKDDKPAKKRKSGHAKPE
jgi:hypothetical protein